MCWCFTIENFCCMRLHTAGIVIGWINSVLSGLQSIIYIYMICNIDDIINQMEAGRIPPYSTYGTHIDSMEYSYSIHSSHNYSQLKYVGTKGASLFMIISLTFCLLDLLSSALVVIGTNRNSHLMLVPWLLSAAISLTIRITVGVIIVIACIASEVPSALGIFIFLLVGCFLGINCWIWNAIYSLFRLIRTQNEDSSDEVRLTGNAHPPGYELFKNTQNI